MGLIAVRSTSGSDVNSGEDWDNAKATIEGARLIAVAGDTIYVSQAHAQAFTTVGYTFTSPGTTTAPVRLLVVDDAAWPPVSASATKAALTATTGHIAMEGNLEYGGFTIEGGQGTSSNAIVAAQHTSANGMGVIRTRNNVYRQLSTSGRPISVGSSTGYGGLDIFDQCEFHLGGSVGGTQALSITKGKVEMNECKFSATMNLPGQLFDLGSYNYGEVDLLCTGTDMSMLGSALVLIRNGKLINTSATFRNCKFPSEWSEAVFSAGAICPGTTASLHNCTAGSTVIRYLRWDSAGIIRSNEVNVCSGGSADDAAYSLKLTTNAIANDVNALLTPELPAKYIASVGSPVTATVEILADSDTALTDRDIWLEGTYLANAGDTLAKVTTGRPAIYTDATTLPTSTATWVEAGVTNPQKRKLQVTFTPQRAGYLSLRVAAAVKSVPIFVDHKITVA